MISKFNQSCKHTGALFIQSARSSPDGYAEHVSICPRCGKITVRLNRGDVYLSSEFALSTDEHLLAAMQYASLIFYKPTLLEQAKKIFILVGHRAGEPGNEVFAVKATMEEAKQADYKFSEFFETDIYEWAIGEEMEYD